MLNISKDKKHEYFNHKTCLLMNFDADLASVITKMYIFF